MKTSNYLFSQAYMAASYLTQKLEILSRAMHGIAPVAEVVKPPFTLKINWISLKIFRQNIETFWSVLCG